MVRGQTKEPRRKVHQSSKTKDEEIILHPEAYGSRSNKTFREAKVEFFPYLIVYKIKKRTKEIYISSIYHTKKHPRKKYRKE